MDTDTTTITVADYCHMFERREVRVNRDYQRHDQVWPRTAQSFLIETILLGLPIPKLSLHQRTDPRTRRTVKEVVDGQQRTRAIYDFFEDQFRLTSNVVLEDARGRSYETLPEDLQQRFLDYALDFDLFTQASEAEVREVFRRMNSFTVPLNAEEQRHATFQGEFKWFMRRLTGDYGDEFIEAGVFSSKAIVRMRDAKLLTEVSSAYFDGISTTNKARLDRVYRSHDKEADFPEEPDLGERLRAGLDLLFSWEDLAETPLMKPYQVYSLLLAVMHLQDPIDALAEEDLPADPELEDEATILVNLTRLSDALDDEVEGDHPLAPFVSASSERTNVGSQRSARFQWFCRALADDLPE